MAPGKRGREGSPLRCGMVAFGSGRAEALRYTVM